MTDTTTATPTPGAGDDSRRDWAIRAIVTHHLDASNREAAEEWAAGYDHLTVVSRVPGGEWEPPAAGTLAQLTNDQLRAGLAELDDSRLYFILEHAGRLLTDRNRASFAGAVREAVIEAGARLEGLTEVVFGTTGDYDDGPWYTPHGAELRYADGVTVVVDLPGVDEGLTEEAELHKPSDGDTFVVRLSS